MGGYVTFVVGIFILILAYLFIGTPVSDKVTPSPSPKPVAYCEKVDASTTETFEAPQDNATKCPYGPTGRYVAGGNFRNKFEGNTTYKLIRKNVPLNVSFFADGSEHSNTAENLGIKNSLDPLKFKLYFPEITGEIKLSQKMQSRTRVCRKEDGGYTDLLYFMDYGLAFALILENGKPIEVKGTDNTGQPNTFYLTNVYKDTQRPEIPPEVNAFACSSGISSQNVMIPKQVQSPDQKQLQLEYFLFGQGAVTNGWNDTCKPAIYLYPKQKQLVNVKVYPIGFLSYVDPVYDSKTGWTVEANPDGQIVISDKLQVTSYPYLYYESKIRDEVIKKPERGWVVRFEDLEKTYRDILPKLGLNKEQTGDFIDYWKKALPYSAYYFVGVIDPENVNYIERLEITPKPDYINRVRIYFEALDQFKEVQSPDLSAKDSQLMTNDSFRVDEWGGMVKRNKDHPFTCSQ